MDKFSSAREAVRTWALENLTEERLGPSLITFLVLYLVFAIGQVWYYRNKKDLSH